MLTQVTCKKSGRWTIAEEVVSKYPSISELAADLWKANEAPLKSNAPVCEVARQEAIAKPSLQQQLLFRAQPKSQIPDAVGQVESQKNHLVNERLGLEQYGCLPV